MEPHHPLIRFFAYEHLPEHLRAVSKEFYDLATWMELSIPENDEMTMALRKLLEAKDCAVRARIIGF